MTGHTDPGGLEPRPSRLRRAVTVLVVVAAVSVAVLTLVSPLRQILAQEQRLDDVREQAEELERENADLEKRIDRLSDDSEIERLAREELGLVKPGEQVYMVLPDPGTGQPPPGPIEQPVEQPAEPASD